MKEQTKCSNIETQIGPIYVSYIDENDLDNFINRFNYIFS